MVTLISFTEPRLYEICHKQGFIGFIKNIDINLSKYINLSEARLLNHYIQVCLNFGDSLREILSTSIIQNNFAELAQLLQNSSIIDLIFLKNLTREKIVYLLMIEEKRYFSSNEIEALLLSYNQFHDNKAYQELLLKIAPNNQKALTLIKKFLINQILNKKSCSLNFASEYTILFHLGKIFSDQKLSSAEAEQIVKSDLTVWNVCPGIKFIQRFRILTSNINDYFISIAQEDIASGSYQSNSSSIWRDLIVPLLNEELFNQKNSIDQAALIKMISTCLELANNNINSYYSLNVSQFKCLIRLIKEALVNSIASAQTLNNSIDALVKIAKATNMKLIAADSSLLLILDDKFSEKISFADEKIKIIKLVEIRARNNDPAAFDEEYNKITESLQCSFNRQSLNSELDLSAYSISSTNSNMPYISRKSALITRL